MKSKSKMFAGIPDEGDVSLLRQFKAIYNEKKSDEELVKWWMTLKPSHINDDDYFIPNSKQISTVRAEFKDPYMKQFDQATKDLQTWFKLHPHLPQPSGCLVDKFIWCKKGDVEKAKKAMLQYYSLRGTDEEIFTNRDPCNQLVQKTYRSSFFCCLPQLTDDLLRVSLGVLINTDPEEYDVNPWMRRLFYIADLRVDQDFCLGDAIIYDLNGYTLHHLKKFTISLVKKLTVATEGALPSRIKQIHIINGPSYTDTMLQFFKPFLKEKIYKRIHVHNNIQDLYKCIPQEILPTEYGGKAGTLAEINEKLQKELESNKDWYLSTEKEMRRIYMEGKRAGKLFMDSGELYGMEGSFKKLDID